MTGSPGVLAMFNDQGGGGSTLDQRVAKYVATLKLEDKLEPLGLVANEDTTLALLQVQILGQNIWRELEPVVRFACPFIFPHVDELSDDEYGRRFKVVFDEQIMRGIQLVARETRKGRCVGLGELATEIYSPESEEYGPFRARLREKVLPPLEDLAIFSYTEQFGKSSAGREYHKGFQIEAGPALNLFINHVFRPWSERHVRFLTNLLSGESK